MRSVADVLREVIEPRLRVHGFAGSAKNAIRLRENREVALVCSTGGVRFNVGGRWAALTGVPPMFTVKLALHAGRGLPRSARSFRVEPPIAETLEMPFHTDRFRGFDVLGMAQPAGTNGVAEAVAMIERVVSEAEPFASLDDVWALAGATGERLLRPNESALMTLAAREGRADVCRELVARWPEGATILRTIASSFDIEL